MNIPEQRGVAKLIILGLLTCGIYIIIWYYHFAQEVKDYTGSEEAKPGTDLVLCLVTCGIYAIYWPYKYGKLLVEAQRKAGLPENDESVIYLVLAIFGLGIVSIGMMQASANKIWAAASGGAGGAQPMA